MADDTASTPQLGGDGGDRTGELPQCDLVMKGGITSGVVYPGAIQELAGHYRFRNIGGSSAGAIAAAVCAAAEYDRGGGGMRKLADVVKDLEQPGFLTGLFQPAARTRDAFDAALRLVGERPLRRKVAAAALVAIRRRPLPALVALIGLAAFAIVAASAVLTPTDDLGLPGALVVGAALVLALPALALSLLGAGGGALALVLREARAALPETDYGLCPGSHPEHGEALVEWLHRRIQTCAGRGVDDAPLTFGELAERGIRLEMTSTDLSYARPVRLPVDAGAYLFKPGEMLERFPERLVAQMVAAADGSSVEEARGRLDSRLRRLSPDGLPVLVAVRLSLSFPGLLSAMRLYSAPTADAEPARHLLSDGGICSNFPIHFFDRWFPERPTFGIDLAEFPARASADEPDVFIADPERPAPPRWSEVGDLGDFVTGLKDATQNWRDAMQAEMPGFRERVCQVRLRPGEGGLNLDMPPSRIRTLNDRGSAAGRALEAAFRPAGEAGGGAAGGTAWVQNRWIRYLALMQLVQRSLQDMAAKFPEFAASLEAGLPGVEAFRAGHDPNWCGRAADATDRLLAIAGEWGPRPSSPDFDEDGVVKPEPIGALRLIPNA